MKTAARRLIRAHVDLDRLETPMQRSRAITRQVELERAAELLEEYADALPWWKEPLAWAIRRAVKILEAMLEEILRALRSSRDATPEKESGT